MNDMLKIGTFFCVQCYAMHNQVESGYGLHNLDELLISTHAQTYPQALRCEIQPSLLLCCATLSGDWRLIHSPHVVAAIFCLPLPFCVVSLCLPLGEAVKL